MHTLSFHVLEKINNPELWELNISMAIRSLAAGLVDVFLPLYLYQNGLDLQTIFLFYIALNAFNIVLSPLLAKIISKVGPKHSLMWNVPFQIGFYMLVYSFTSFDWSIYLLAFVLSIAHTFFRQGFHVQVIKNTTKKDLGKSLGLIRALQIVSKSLSPFLGGLLILFFSYNLALVVASALLLLSNLPLLFTKDSSLDFDLNFKKILKSFKWNEFASLFAAGIEYEANFTIWPIILVIFLNNSFVTTGLITTLSILFSVIASYMVGRISDIKGNVLLWIGVVATSIFWGLRSFVSAGWHIFMVDACFGFANTLKNIPYESKIYNKFRDQDMMHYLMFHQFSVNFGRLAFFIVLFIFPNLLISLWAGFGSGWLNLLF
jgi:MFS family permease